MAWQPILNDLQTLQTGERVRVSFDFAGWLMDDVGSAVSVATPLEVTQVNRSLLGFVESVEGQMKSGSTVGQLKDSVKLAVDTWSTFNVRIIGVDSSALAISDFAPSTQTAITAVSVAVIAAVLLIAALVYREELGL